MFGRGARGDKFRGGGHGDEELVERGARGFEVRREDTGGGVGEFERVRRGGGAGEFWGWDEVARWVLYGIRIKSIEGDKEKWIWGDGEEVVRRGWRERGLAERGGRLGDRENARKASD